MSMLTRFRGNRTRISISSTRPARGIRTNRRFQPSCQGSKDYLLEQRATPGTFYFGTGDVSSGNIAAWTDFGNTNYNDTQSGIPYGGTSNQTHSRTFYDQPSTGKSITCEATWDVLSSVTIPKSGTAPLLGIVIIGEFANTDKVSTTATSASPATIDDSKALTTGGSSGSFTTHVSASTITVDFSYSATGANAGFNMEYFAGVTVSSGDYTVKVELNSPGRGGGTPGAYMPTTLTVKLLYDDGDDITTTVLQSESTPGGTAQGFTITPVTIPAASTMSVTYGGSLTTNPRGEFSSSSTLSECRQDAGMDYSVLITPN